MTIKLTAVEVAKLEAASPPEVVTGSCYAEAAMKVIDRRVILRGSQSVS